MIVVVDTNVVVSGVLKPYSKPAAILRMMVEGTLRPALDVRILEEYRNVLSRPHFNLDRDNIRLLLVQFEEEGLHVLATPLKFQLPDPDDEPFLEVALAAEAAALVTGNKRHFPAGEYDGAQVLSPAEFLKFWAEKSSGSVP